MQVASYLQLSVAVAIASTALKAAAWWLTGSVGLLSDALGVASSTSSAQPSALAMVTVAAQPPDADHQYGHHKAEYFSSGLEGVLILVAALAIVWTALPRLFAPQPLCSLGLGLSFSVFSVGAQRRPCVGDAAQEPRGAIRGARG